MKVKEKIKLIVLDIDNIIDNEDELSATKRYAVVKVKSKISQVKETQQLEIIEDSINLNYLKNKYQIKTVSEL